MTLELHADERDFWMLIYERTYTRSIEQSSSKWEEDAHTATIMADKAVLALRARTKAPAGGPYREGS